MNTSISLHKSRALVSGAAGGIGLAIIEGMLTQGANVLATDLKTSDGLERLLEQYPTQLIYIEANLAEDEELEALLQKAQDWNVNTLVNNAAIFDMAPLWESDLGQYDRLFHINVRAMFRLMQGVCSHLREHNQRGKIINFSSQAGRRGEALVSHYCATKAAVISYTQSAALAFAEQGININAISPGVIDTPMWDAVDKLFAKYEKRPLGEKKRLVGEAVPMGRMGDPEDIVGAVLFLASDLSNYITGQTLNVDGGCVLN